jgi:hypothetical protein
LQASGGVEHCDIDAFDVHCLKLDGGCPAALGMRSINILILLEIMAAVVRGVAIVAGG